MNCEDVRQWIERVHKKGQTGSDHEERETDREVDEHLNFCQSCSDLLDQAEKATWSDEFGQMVIKALRMTR